MKFAKIYNKVAPEESPSNTINVPSHLPKIKPPIKKLGEPNPKSKTQMTVKEKNTKIESTIFVFLKSSSLSLLVLINSKLVKSFREKYLKKNIKYGQFGQ